MFGKQALQRILLGRRAKVMHRIPYRLVAYDTEILRHTASYLWAGRTRPSERFEAIREDRVADVVDDEEDERIAPDR